MQERRNGRVFKNAEELQIRLDKYKAYLEETGKPPTIAGLAYYTGMHRSTIYLYEKREEYDSVLVDFRDWVLMNYEEFAIEKGGGGIIFLLKNYGYTDKQEMQLSGSINNPFKELTADELRKLSNS